MPGLYPEEQRKYLQVSPEGNEKLLEMYVANYKDWCTSAIKAVNRDKHRMSHLYSKQKVSMGFARADLVGGGSFVDEEVHSKTKITLTTPRGLKEVSYGFDSEKNQFKFPIVDAGGVSNVRAYVASGEKLPSAYENDALIHKGFAFSLFKEPTPEDITSIMGCFEKAVTKYKCRLPSMFGSVEHITTLVKSAWDQISNLPMGLQCSEEEGLVVFPVLIQEPMYLYVSTDLVKLMSGGGVSKEYMLRDPQEDYIPNGKVDVWANIKPGPDDDIAKGCCTVHPKGKFCPANGGQYINTNINAYNIRAEYYRMFVHFGYQNKHGKGFRTDNAVVPIGKLDEMKYSFLKWLKDSMTDRQLEMEAFLVKLHVNGYEEQEPEKKLKDHPSATVVFVYE